MSDNEWSYSRCRDKTKLEYCAHIAKLEIEMGAVAASRDYMEKEMEFYKKMYREKGEVEYKCPACSTPLNLYCPHCDGHPPDAPKGKNPFIGGPLSMRDTPLAERFKCSYRRTGEVCMHPDTKHGTFLTSCLGLLEDNRCPLTDEEPPIKDRYNRCTCPHRHEQRTCPDIVFDDGVAYCAIQPIEPPTEESFTGPRNDYEQKCYGLGYSAGVDEAQQIGQSFELEGNI